MIGLPEPGDLVRIYPFPGRLVQDGPRPVDRVGGGKWLPSKGRVVKWSQFHLEQLLAGDLLLHAPPCDEHEFGNDIDGECSHCGRSKDEAAKYDAHAAPYRTGKAAPAEARKYNHAEASRRALKAAEPESEPEAKPAEKKPEAKKADKPEVK